MTRSTQQYKGASKDDEDLRLALINLAKQYGGYRTGFIDDESLLSLEESLQKSRYRNYLRRLADEKQPQLGLSKVG